MAAGKRIAVIGGGWAGIAAAVDATRRGHAVTLYEMAAQFGGRARSVEADGVVLDNGQHILIGAYSATLALMRTVGVDPERVLQRLPLTLVDASGAGLRLRPGPPMLAFARAVLGHAGWPLRERLALLGAALRWMLAGFRCAAHTSVATLTAGLGPRVRAELIEPLCVAALNTPAREASGTVFLRVLKDALFSGPGSADLLLPRAGLGELLPGPACAWLASRGAVLKPSTRVERLERVEPIAGAGGIAWSVDGIAFDAVVLATTSVEAARLVQPIAPDWAAVAAALRFEPIVTLYLRGAGAALPEPMLALACDDTERPAQFVFDRGQLSARSGGLDGVLAFVVSGAAPWVARGMPQTLEATRRQADALLGPGRPALEALRTFTEKRATFRCTPALVRPAVRIAPGLAAAADYVAGPYPATLEGAVRSAHEALAAIDGDVASTA